MKDMMRHQTTKSKAKRKRGVKPRGSTRFPGICADAESLGVNRSSLYRVLSGEWDLPSLKKRYTELREKGGAK